MEPFSEKWILRFLCTVIIGEPFFFIRLAIGCTRSTDKNIILIDFLSQVGKEISMHLIGFIGNVAHTRLYWHHNTRAFDWISRHVLSVIVASYWFGYLSIQNKGKKAFTIGYSKDLTSIKTGSAKTHTGIIALCLPW